MNEKQLEAVKSLNNTLVIAGPGAGKTFTIINKVEYLIKNKIYKENEILLISFTNESVNDLKKKLNYNIDILTFHKLAMKIMQNKEYKIANNYTLDYIINEYIESYCNKNTKAKYRLKRILKENTLLNFKKLISTFINLYKSNYPNIYYLYNLYKKSHFITKDYFHILLELYTLYNKELTSNGQIDLNDLIIEATKEIENTTLPYKYIIIDEFQDTSQIRFNLIKAIMTKNNAKLFAVGDDFQSIYRFSGCNLYLFLNLKNEIPDLNIINLEYNYRNPKELIYIANNFIMKNKHQIPKKTITISTNPKPIKIYFYVNKSKVINKILEKVDNDYLVLGRNNNDKESFNVKNEKFLTVHKSKGLEANDIILINLENNNHSLPSKIKDHKIISKILNKDLYPYEEERRLFYVALTRARNNVYILAPKTNYSVFIKELLKDYGKYIEIKK